VTLCVRVPMARGGGIRANIRWIILKTFSILSEF
jgi:hypothetical protein